MIPIPTTIREATPADMPAVRALLTASGLPTVGTDSSRLFILKVGHILGVVGFEDYAPYALLRSLAVVPEVRARGYGRTLLNFVLRQTEAERVHAVYGLTTTIPGWLLRTGFSEVARSGLPAALHASEELRGACSASARVFVKTL